MLSKCKDIGEIKIPEIYGKYIMMPFDVENYNFIDEWSLIVKEMLRSVVCTGIAYLTIHGRDMNESETLRRPGPHTDGNYEPHNMTFGGGGWKVGENGPRLNSELHKKQYLSESGGILMASNLSSCRGWIGDYDGSPGVGGDCSHISLDDPFRLEKNTVYYGNNQFIHESLPCPTAGQRTLIRITLPESHNYHAIKSPLQSNHNGLRISNAE